MGKTDLEDLMLNRWFEKLCKKIGYGLLAPDFSNLSDDG